MTVAKSELEIYDRQIRLWGMKAQERMRTSKVLLVGTGGAASEVAKNLILAGVGGLTVVCPNEVDARLLEASFLLTAEDSGQAAALALAKRLEPYNPNVAVKGLRSNPAELTAEELKDYSSVIACNQRLDTVLTLNKLTRGADTAFFSCNSMGLTGFMFADLVKHEYLHITTKDDGSEKKVKKDAVWCSLEEMIGMPTKSWKRVFRRKRIKWQRAVVLLALAAMKFESPKDGPLEKFLRDRAPDWTPSDQELNRAFALRDITLAPPNAVMGGQVAQEVLNYIQGRNLPMRNIRVFDLNQSNSSTEVYLGPEPEKKPEKKAQDFAGAMELD